MKRAISVKSLTKGGSDDEGLELKREYPGHIEKAWKPRAEILVEPQLVSLQDLGGDLDPVPPDAPEPSELERFILRVSASRSLTRDERGKLREIIKSTDPAKIPMESVGVRKNVGGIQTSAGKNDENKAAR